MAQHTDSVKVDRWKSHRAPEMAVLREQLVTEGYKPRVWSDMPGTYYPKHEHSFGEVRWVVSGSMTFEFQEDESEIVLMPGDRIWIPAYCIHSATTGCDGETVYLFAYSD